MTSKFSWRIVGFCGLLLLALILLQVALAEAATARDDRFLYGKVTTGASAAASAPSTSSASTSSSRDSRAGRARAFSSHASATSPASARGRETGPRSR